MKVMGKHKQLAICIAAALCAASTGFAATSHWNDASATPQAETQTAVGTADWQQWKTAWEKIRTGYEQVSMAPGKDSSCLNFGWYSREQAEKAEVRIAKTQDMKAAKTFHGTSQTGTVIDGTTYFTNKVEVSGLQSGQSYWYQVKLDGKWQQAHEVKTAIRMIFPLCMWEIRRSVLRAARLQQKAISRMVSSQPVMTLIIGIKP